MGLTLRWVDFQRISTYPAAVIVGLTNQIILLPIIALILVTLIPLSPVMAMGVMVLSACPGGATSNLIAHLSKGDTALSITLTACSSLITIFTIPFILNFSLAHLMGEAGRDIQLPILPTILNIIKLTALPVAMGMFINHHRPQWAERSQKALAWGSGVFILLALALMLLKVSEYGSVWSFVKAAGPVVFLFNILTMALGFFSARILKLGVPQAITISLESGMQNGVLGMAIATAPNLLNTPLMATAPGVYGLFMVFTGVVLISYFRRMAVVNQ